MVAGQERMEHGDGPGERDKMETQVRVSQKRSAVGHRQCPTGRERETPARREDVTVNFRKMVWQPLPRPKRGGILWKKNE